MALSLVYITIKTIKTITNLGTMVHSIPIPQRECVAIFQNKENLMVSK